MSHIDNSFWFFYCPECKRDPAPGILRAVKIVKKRYRIGNTTQSHIDYDTDSSNYTGSDDEFTSASAPEDSTPLR